YHFGFNQFSHQRNLPADARYHTQRARCKSARRSSRGLPRLWRAYGFGHRAGAPNTNNESNERRYCHGSQNSSRARMIPKPPPEGARNAWNSRILTITGVSNSSANGIKMPSSISTPEMISVAHTSGIM